MTSPQDTPNLDMFLNFELCKFQHFACKIVHIKICACRRWIPGYVGNPEKSALCGADFHRNSRALSM